MKKRRPRGYWTKETVEKEVEELLAVQSEVKLSELYKNNKSLYVEIIRFYGSVENFKKETGLEIEFKQKQKPKGYWSKERVKQEVEDILDKKGTLKSNTLRKENNSLYQNIINNYGSIEKFVKETGIEIEYKYRPKGYWSKETVKQEIEKILEEQGEIKLSNLRRNQSKIYRQLLKEYGSVENFIKETGIEIKMQKQKPTGYWTKEKLHEIIRELYHQGKPIKLQTFKEEYGGGMVKAFYREYGTLKNFLEESGIKK